jgi:drug/metabolite transporter (DMT)-like permease
MTSEPHPRAPLWLGALFGVSAALIWGSQLAMSRAGAGAGLDGFDVAALRGGAAGIAMLPWLLRRKRYGNGPGLCSWPHALGLAAAAGPLFMIASMAGFHYAPLPHGAVLQPSMMVLSSMFLSALLLGEKLRPRRLIGASVIVLGLVAIAGPAVLQGDRLTPIGDALFLFAGALFAIYSVLQRRWTVSPLHATGSVTVVAAALFLPPYLAFHGLGHLLALPWGMLVAQVLVQGLLTGIVSLIVFGRAIQILGAGRATLFPALVPGAAVLLGIPLVGEWPTALQLGGLAVVTAGLVFSLSSGTRKPLSAPPKST